jgi:hypothetical protein
MNEQGFASTDPVALRLADAPRHQGVH